MGKLKDHFTIPSLKQMGHALVIGGSCGVIFASAVKLVQRYNYRTPRVFVNYEASICPGHGVVIDEGNYRAHLMTKAQDPDDQLRKVTLDFISREAFFEHKTDNWMRDYTLPFEEMPKIYQDAVPRIMKHFSQNVCLKEKVDAGFKLVPSQP